MADKDDAQGQEPEGNTEFAAEFARLGNEERQAPGEAAPDPEAAKLDGQKQDEPGGQGQEAPPAHSAPADTPGASEAPDIWANATPEQLAERDKLLQSVRTQSGRLSTVQRELNAIKTGLVENGGKAGAKAQELDERFKTLREEYPDVAGPLIDVIEELRGQVGKLTTVTVARTDAEIGHALSEQQNLVEQAHPGMLDKVTGELEQEFVSWAKQQPRFVLEAIERNGANGVQDAAEVIDILDRFQASRGGSGQADQFRQRRERQLSAGRVPGVRQPAFTPNEEPDDFANEWKRLAAKEQASGRR